MRIKSENEGNIGRKIKWIEKKGKTSKIRLDGIEEILKKKRDEKFKE